MFKNVLFYFKKGVVKLVKQDKINTKTGKEKKKTQKQSKTKSRKNKLKEKSEIKKGIKESPEKGKEIIEGEEILGKGEKRREEGERIKEKIKAVLNKERVVTENTNEAKLLYDKSRFGSKLDDGRLQLSLLEALYLEEKNRLKIVDGRRKKIEPEKFIKKASKIDKHFWTRYCVFKDLRQRGFIVKTALKFGADFRVYDRGVKPGEDHAKWVVYPVNEATSLTWYEFAAKNRVAHSTRKRLLIGIVDEEGDVTYYEIRWIRP